MPPVARKTAAKKPAAPVKTITADFEYVRETTGTYRLNETGAPEDHISGAIYLKKGPLGSTKPSRIEVTVKVYE